MIVSRPDKNREYDTTPIVARATTENLNRAHLAYLDDPARVAELAGQFMRIHHVLRRQTDDSAAKAVLALCKY